MQEALRTAPFRVASLIQNALELARLSRLGHVEHAPYETVLRDPVFRLRHYRGAADGAAGAPAILLVPPLMLTAEVYDIAPEGSAVVTLREGGVDPWVVDFGAPERQVGGLQRTLADHVLAISRAVDAVRAEIGADVHLAGYSQGGMFCYQAAAYRRSAGIASLITFGSPVDIRRELVPGVPDKLVAGALDVLGRFLAAPFAGSAVPAWLSRNVFKLLSPMKEVRNQLEFFTRLQDPETARRRAGQRRFLASEGWVAWPGPAVRDFVEQFLVQNRLFSGGFVIDGRTLSLTDVTCPILTFVGETDDLARPAGVRAIREAAPRAEVFEVTVDAGHFGLVVGAVAMKETWPLVVRWLHWRSGKGKRPARVVPAAWAAAREAKGAGGPGARQMAWRLGREAAEWTVEILGEGGRAARSVLLNLSRQLPLVRRLSGVTRRTRIGLGLLLAEQAAANPRGTFFLFGGRAYTYSDANRRVDAVVRGLIAIGVRQGEHVGVYMHSRPTALALVTAINRLGAVAVLLRPDGDLKRELELGNVEHLVADPEHGAVARAAFCRDVFVLGGGGAARTFPRGLIDMERIDPERVSIPEWYRPSPGRAEEVAFILFAGQGTNTRANRITNRRWALSALGAASAAALTPNDTVYCWTAIQHPTGLLVSMSSALVGGARLALANGFSAATFWEEVRRYGASVVFYAGTMCRELVDAPPDPVEHSHPVRLFAGSGMPAPVWRRVVERFGPVSVLEFYASTEGTAILANVSGEKVGSVGRPLPGSAEVEIAAYDPLSATFLHDAAGYCIPVVDGEVGMLLARVERERGALDGKPMRSVFSRGDAWLSTGDLFRRDEDGDYWLVDHAADVIRSRGGPLFSIPIEDAVAELESVSTAAAYGLRLGGSEHEIPCVAVALRPGAELDPDALQRHVRERLDRSAWPVIVRVVESIPMTAGYRFQKEPLRAAGLARAEEKPTQAFWLDPATRKYRPFDGQALRRLSATRRRVGTQRSRPPAPATRPRGAQQRGADEPREERAT